MEADQVGKRQDLSNYIVNIQRTDTPLFTEIPKDTVRKSTFETQVDDYGETNDIGGVGTSEDAADFKNQAENRGIIDNQVMKMWEKPMVDDFAENVNENEALPAGEYVEAVRKSVVRLKFRVEKRLFSRVEGTRQEGGRKFGTCAIGGFLKSGAPIGDQRVSERFRMPAAHEYTGTLEAYTENHARGIMKAIFESTNGKGKFKHYVGSSLQEAYTLMSIYRPDKASNTVIQRINAVNNTTLSNTVTMIQGDFGMMDLVPTTRMRYYDMGATIGTMTETTAAQRQGSGVILDLSMWGLAFKRKPGHKRLEDKGGGPRGIVDTIFGLRCKNPRGNGAVWVSE
jgi:hypothetical protein